MIHSAVTSTGSVTDYNDFLEPSVGELVEPLDAWLVSLSNHQTLVIKKLF